MVVCENSTPPTVWANPTGDTMQAFVGAFHANAVAVASGETLMSITGLTTTEQENLRLIVLEAASTPSYIFGIPQQNGDQGRQQAIGDGVDLAHALVMHEEIWKAATSSGVKLTLVDALGRILLTRDYFGTSLLNNELLQQADAAKGIYTLIISSDSDQYSLQLYKS